MGLADNFVPHIRGFFATVGFADNRVRQIPHFLQDLRHGVLQMLRIMMQTTNPMYQS
jgi:hypothetical protein